MSSTGTHGNTLSVSETVESLTGFEEIAIEKRFEGDINTLLVDRSTMGLRALAFTVFARAEGTKAEDAYKLAMALKLSEVNEFFPDEQDEPVEDEPVYDQGKDDSLLA